MARSSSKSRIPHFIQRLANILIRLKNDAIHHFGVGLRRCRRLLLSSAEVVESINHALEVVAETT